MRSTVYFVVIFTSLLISCKNASNSPQDSNPIVPVPTQNYLPGRVAVGFIDSVNYSFISSFFQRLNLEPIGIYADSSFSMWIRVDSGNVNQPLVRLQQDSAVVWADQRGYDGGDPLKAYLMVHFRGTVVPEYALELIQSISGISWERTIVSPRNALIKVEIGQENRWIDSLRTYPFVTWAELDYIIHVSEN